jgi:hypothetical protein
MPCASVVFTIGKIRFGFNRFTKSINSGLEKGQKQFFRIAN